MHSSILHTPSKINIDNAYNWLKQANIVNKRFAPIFYKQLQENADIICILFNQLNCDKNDVIQKFYSIYENSKYVNIPIEVINIPLDETEADFRRSFKEQANWFTLKFDDPLVHTLKYMYEITCVPQLRIINIDTTLISRDGIGDIEEYGQNAVITWLPTSASSKKHRHFKNDAYMYGPKWIYIDANRRNSMVRKPMIRGWSLSEAEERKTSERASRSSKSASYSTKSDADDDDSDNKDDDDKRKPFYESNKFLN